jgi:hypothetical protein
MDQGCPALLLDGEPAEQNLQAETLDPIGRRVRADLGVVLIVAPRQDLPLMRPWGRLPQVVWLEAGSP